MLLIIMLWHVIQYRLLCVCLMSTTVHMTRSMHFGVAHNWLSVKLTKPKKENSKWKFRKCASLRTNLMKLESTPFLLHVKSPYVCITGSTPSTSWHAQSSPPCWGSLCDIGGHRPSNVRSLCLGVLGAKVCNTHTHTPHTCTHVHMCKYQKTVLLRVVSWYFNEYLAIKKL